MCYPFNSLSRDHVHGTLIELSRHSGSLSTPSLGITGRVIGAPARRRPMSVFQLPLSGSLHRRSERERGPGRRAFNSLSRDHKTGAGALHSVPIPELSTPSLGITDKVMRVIAPERWEPFNSLSRDHTTPARIYLLS